MQAERTSALHIVAHNDAPVQRLALARRHVETAIAHINEVAQAHMPGTLDGDSRTMDELRLIVRALADIREALRASDLPAQAVPALSTSGRPEEPA